MVSRKPVSELSNEELLSRMEGLLKAVYIRNSNRMMIPMDVDYAFREAYHEVAQRQLNHKLKLPDCVSVHDPEPIHHERRLVRYFSNHKFLDSFCEGKLSFSFAAGFRNDPNSARCDDEHSRIWLTENQTLKIGGIDYWASDLRMENRIADANGTDHPYHFVSFSYEESLKIARDFGAVGWVLINDPNALVHLIKDALWKQFPNALTWLSYVEYYDDLEPLRLKSPNHIWSVKPIGFLYQREARIVILNSGITEGRLELQIDVPAGLFDVIRPTGIGEPA